MDRGAKAEVEVVGDRSHDGGGLDVAYNWGSVGKLVDVLSEQGSCFLVKKGDMGCEFSSWRMVSMEVDAGDWIRGGWNR